MNMANEDEYSSNNGMPTSYMHSLTKVADNPLCENSLPVSHHNAKIQKTCSHL